MFNSTEWLRSDSRRTVVGLDLDLEALNWCMESNIPKVGADGFSRMSLFHGNVLQPLQSKLVKIDPQQLVSDISLSQNEENLQTDVPESDAPTGSVAQDDKYTKRNIILPGRDIVCAFNYSCCCLHKRAELVLYFKHAREALSTKGGIFVMDVEECGSNDFQDYFDDAKESRVKQNSKDSKIKFQEQSRSRFKNQEKTQSR